MIKNSLFFHVLSLGMISLCMTSTSSMAVELYKWVDKDGVVTYSSSAPKGVSATKVEINPNSAVSVGNVSEPAPKKRVPGAKNSNARPRASQPSARQNNMSPAALAAEQERLRLIRACEENRGTDCESEETIELMRSMEQPLGIEARHRIAGARNNREREAAPNTTQPNTVQPNIVQPNIVQPNTVQP